MRFLSQRLTLAGLTAGLMLGLTAEPAAAQLFPFQRGFPPAATVYPDVRVQQAAANLAVLGQAYAAVPPRAFGFNPFVRPAIAVGGGVNPFVATPFTNPPGLAAAGLVGGGAFTSTLPATAALSTSPYGTGYFEEPVAGYLRGAADVIKAQEQFLIGTQQAALMRQQVLQARLETRRRIFDQWLYERANTPNWMDLREEAQALDLRRSQLNPMVTEIVSGKALNALLEHAATLQAKGVRGPTVPLDPDNVKQINVTTLAGGNIGVLKNNGELHWPQTLLGTEYEEERRVINRAAEEAVRQAKGGRVDPGTVSDLSNAVERLRIELSRNVFDIPPTNYIEASRFLRQLGNAIDVLKSPSASKYFTGEYTAEGKNAAELVQYMAKRGLRFAPAMDDDVAAYTAIHRALAAYDLALQSLAPPEIETDSPRRTAGKENGPDEAKPAPDRPGPEPDGR